MLLILLVLLVYFSLISGRVATPLNPLEWGGSVSFVVYELRLPRIILAVLVGSALAVAGAVYQTIFRNPLASPKILGVSEGASTGVALAILLFYYNRIFIELLGFIFGLAATMLTLYLSRVVKYGGSILRLILAGMAVSAFFAAMIGLIKFLADPYQILPSITFWLLGSLNGKGWSDLYYAGPLIISALAFLTAIRWRINVLGLSDEEALSLGVNPRLYRPLTIVFASLLVSASTSVAGSIAWIGLLVPHLSRGLFGADNRYVLPGSALIGSSLLLLCDTLSRTLTSYEIPLGIIVSFISAPVFIAILSRGSMRWRR